MPSVIPRRRGSADEKNSVGTCMSDFSLRLFMRPGGYLKILDLDSGNEHKAHFSHFIQSEFPVSGHHFWFAWITLPDQ
jgi:hypothetical protein